MPAMTEEGLAARVAAKARRFEIGFVACSEDTVPQAIMAEIADRMSQQAATECGRWQGEGLGPGSDGEAFETTCRGRGQPSG